MKTFFVGECSRSCAAYLPSALVPSVCFDFVFFRKFRPLFVCFLVYLFVHLLVKAFISLSSPWKKRKKNKAANSGLIFYLLTTGFLWCALICFIFARIRCFDLVCTWWKIRRSRGNCAIRCHEGVHICCTASAKVRFRWQLILVCVSAKVSRNIRNYSAGFVGAASNAPASLSARFAVEDDWVGEFENW